MFNYKWVSHDVVFKPRTFLVSYKTFWQAKIGQKRAQSSCHLWNYSTFCWLQGKMLHHQASCCRWHCEKHRELACLLKTLSAWLLSVNLWFLLAIFFSGSELCRQPAAVCPPEESIKQVKPNAALISYRCCHLPLNTDRFSAVSSGDAWGMALDRWLRLSSVEFIHTDRNNANHRRILSKLVFL